MTFDPKDHHIEEQPEETIRHIERIDRRLEEISKRIDNLYLFCYCVAVLAAGAFAAIFIKLP